jgi:hypothetical protein
MTVREQWTCHRHEACDVPFQEECRDFDIDFDRDFDGLEAGMNQCSRHLLVGIDS